MVRVTEAIFKNGVLKPTQELGLREDERVRITIEPLSEPAMDREEALRAFHRGLEMRRFKSTGPYPTRDELHERG